MLPVRNFRDSLPCWPLETRWTSGLGADPPWLALHSSSIFALSLHPLFPNPPLAVSGGEDDLGYLFCPIPSASEHPFNADTYSPTKLTGHTDSVVATGWSFDGEMVSTGGMDGRVRIWRRVKRTATGDGGVGDWKDWEFLTSLDTGSEITVSP